MDCKRNVRDEPLAIDTLLVDIYLRIGLNYAYLFHSFTERVRYDRHPANGMSVVTGQLDLKMNFAKLIRGR